MREERSLPLAVAGGGGGGGGGGGSRVGRRRRRGGRRKTASDFSLKFSCYFSPRAQEWGEKDRIPSRTRARPPRATVAGGAPSAGARGLGGEAVIWGVFLAAAAAAAWVVRERRRDYCIPDSGNCSCGSFTVAEPKEYH
uniref:Uncharacterized protein n=1 Tax=Oryza rufipogon TaxID=4529 RepID=A0A0E0NB27_ORYRU